MIKNILLVGAGGALGSVARYLLTYILTQLAICSEIATVAVNVVGSFAIGMAISTLGNMGYLFAAVGFCGGFTTFSTFSLQALQLLQTGQRLQAFTYIAASVVICILATFLGIYCAEKWIK